MALKLHKGIVESGGTEFHYSFKTMGARKGIPTKLKLIKLIGPSISSGFASVTTDEKGEAVLSTEDLSNLTSTVLEAISDTESALNLIETLLENVYMDNEEVSFDEYWGEDYGLMYKMAIIVAKANFGSLLSLVGVSPMHSLLPKELAHTA